MRMTTNNLPKQHKDVCELLNDIYTRKNHDYGNSFGDTFRKLGIISAVTRISDKTNRLMSLAVGTDNLVKDESIRDTLMDLANYCIMTIMELDNSEKEEVGTIEFKFYDWKNNEVMCLDSDSISYGDIDNTTHLFKGYNVEDE